MNLKTKLSLLFALLSVAVISAFGAVYYIIFSERIEGRIDNSLDNVINESISFVNKESIIEKGSKASGIKKLRENAARYMIYSPDYYHIMIFTDKGDLLWSLQGNINDSFIQPEQELRTGAFDGDLNGNEVRMKVKRNNGLFYAAAFDLNKLEKETSVISHYLLLALPAIFIIVFAGGYFIISVSLNPLNNLIRSLKNFDATRLSHRISTGASEDEFYRLADKINSMLDKIERSFARVQRFSSDASHEMKTPLTILRGELEIALHGDKSPEEYQEIIINALDEVIRLSRMVEALLELSRAERGEAPMNFEWRDMTRLVRDITDDVVILAMDKNITVRQDIEDEVYMEFDQARMHQAILNVVDNAIKYSYENGNLDIVLQAEEDNVKLIVSDDGKGIPDDQLPYIFDRFYRADSSMPDSDIKGTGLGLSIVKWIIDSHNGMIGVKSKESGGTRFTITIPRRQNGSK